MPPSHFLIFLKGNLLQIYSGLEVILRYFCFTKFVVLDLSLLYLFHQVRCTWIILEWSESPFLVILLGLNLPCLLFLFFDLAQSCRARFRFYSIFSWTLCFFVSREPRPVSFLVFVVFTNLLELKASFDVLDIGCLFSSDLSNVYWCGPGWSHMDC